MPGGKRTQRGRPQLHVFIEGTVLFLSFVVFFCSFLLWFFVFVFVFFCCVFVFFFLLIFFKQVLHCVFFSSKGSFGVVLLLSLIFLAVSNLLIKFIFSMVSFLM